MHMYKYVHYYDMDKHVQYIIHVQENLSAHVHCTYNMYYNKCHSTNHAHTFGGFYIKKQNHQFAKYDHIRALRYVQEHVQCIYTHMDQYSNLPTKTCTASNGFRLLLLQCGLSLQSDGVHLYRWWNTLHKTTLCTKVNISSFDMTHSVEPQQIYIYLNVHTRTSIII